jgi:hypothetical protein
VDPAPPEPGVKRVEGVGVEGACLQTSDEGADVLVHTTRVHTMRRHADVERLPVLVEQLIDSCRGPRVHRSSTCAARRRATFSASDAAFGPARRRFGRPVVAATRSN